MIELKNVKQIGTPRTEDKIYIENMTYNKIKEQSYREKRVFVLMGHTEQMQGRYATFVEAAIPVNQMEFAGGIPKWSNGIWGGVFREIKRLYEDMIIVGWTLEVRGMPPKMTPDLERVHREHFGGVHQIIFLLDTLEQEETFYIYKENKLISKDGFYIYHKARVKENTSVPAVVSPKVDVEVEVVQQNRASGGRYRQLMKEQKKPEKDGGNIGIAVAVAMLIFVLGVGLYENKDSLEAGLLQNVESTEEDTETAVNSIEVEVIPGSE